MKKIFLLNITFIFLSSCCVFISQDCGCDAPGPELLKGARDWIVPFDTLEYLIFEDSLGHTDSLTIERIVDSEFVGGDECGTDMDVERAILQSTQNANLKLTIEGTMNNYVSINVSEDRAQFIYARLDSVNDFINTSGENVSGIIDNNYEWNGEMISVWSIICENASDCGNYEMSRMVISRDLGLLGYTDKAGTIWEKRN